jgi:hypothetical protein
MSWNNVFHPAECLESWQITSRFDGVIKELHYEADDIAKVGKVRTRLRELQTYKLTRYVSH